MFRLPRLVSAVAVLSAAFVVGCPTTSNTGNEPASEPAAEPSTTPDSGNANDDAGNAPSPDTPSPDTPSPDAPSPDTPSPDATPGDAGNANPPPADCGDNDPLTNAAWVGFCGDRVDDNCQVDHPATPCNLGVSAHQYCNTGDEECPSTQPGSAPPSWDCTGDVPANVIAYAQFTESNDQVTDFCVFVYESTAFPGEHYVAVDVTDGTDTRGPDGRCAADYSARRHVYLSDLKTSDGADTGCGPVRYIHAYPNENNGQLYPVDEQKLSNNCRKMMRNIVRASGQSFDPAIQYFAASRAEAVAKLDVLETVEVACVGIDNIDGEPYRTGEEWLTQAAKELTRVP